MTFEFSEGAAGDCISFVSPAPVEPSRGPRKVKRPRPSPEQLAQSAYDRVIALAPRPELRVAPARIGLTGLVSYFWVDNRPGFLRAEARAGPLTVTAEARPVRYLWGFGDGSTRATRHPGRPWTRGRPGNVGHLFEAAGRYDVTVEIVWAARWRINRGTWRDLGYFSTADGETYPVREAISMLVRRPRD